MNKALRNDLQEDPIVFKVSPTQSFEYFPLSLTLRPPSYTVKTYDQ